MAEAPITNLAAAATLDGEELLEVSQLSTSVTITATTISAQASDNSYNDSGSGFVAAGFAVDDRVRVQGFTGNTANNILVGTITALTAGKMTIGGTDGDVIVDDAAGESVTISKWVSRRAKTRNVAAAPSGTSFPGAPADGDRFHRTDIGAVGLDFIYDAASAYWLCTDLGQVCMWIRSVTVDTDAVAAIPYVTTYRLFLERIDITVHRSAAGEWDASFAWLPATGAGTNLATWDGSADASATWIAKSSIINALLDENARSFYLLLDEISGTANATISAVLQYRIAIAP